MSDNFGFDPKLFMKLTEINDDEMDFSQLDLNKINLDITDDDLLKELEALTSPSSTNNNSKNVNNIKSSSATAKTLIPQGNFSMIKVGPEDLNDFNVDNIVLTPDDEQNPELLAELAALTFNYNSKQSESEFEVKEEKEPELSLKLTEKIKELKSEILKLKRDGKIDEAKLKLKELIEFEEKGKGKAFQKIEITKNETQPPLKVSNNSSNLNLINNNVTSKTISPLNLKSATDTQVYREMFAKLQKQSVLCQSVIEFYSLANRKSDANLFTKRKQALDLDLQKLRMMLKNKQPAPEYKTVNVTYEFMLSNLDVPEGELQIRIGKLKIILPRKFKLKETEEYKIRLNYELSGLNEKEMTLTSEPFTTQGLSNNMLGPFVFKINKKDIRVIKSIEYKKIKIEIIAETGFLFFKSTTVKMTGYFKFDKLLKECTVNEEIDLFEVEEGKKKLAIPSGKLLICGRVKGPLGGIDGGLKQNTEKWLVIPEFGNSNHVLYSDLSSPVQSKTTEGSVKSPKVNFSVPLTGTLADQIRSFEVIEYELGLLEGMNLVTMREDENLMDLQVALETLRDRIQMEVELGQLSIEEYLASVKVCISETKTRALQAKSTGNLKLAQKYVKHVDIMRKEVSEAEAAGVEDQG